MKCSGVISPLSVTMFAHILPMSSQCSLAGHCDCQREVIDLRGLLPLIVPRNIVTKMIKGCSWRPFLSTTFRCERQKGGEREAGEREGKKERCISRRVIYQKATNFDFINRPC